MGIGIEWVKLIAMIGLAVNAVGVIMFIIYLIKSGKDEKSMPDFNPPVSNSHQNDFEPLEDDYEFPKEEKSNGIKIVKDEEEDWFGQDIQQEEKELGGFFDDIENEPIQREEKGRFEDLDDDLDEKLSDDFDEEIKGKTKRIKMQEEEEENNMFNDIDLLGDLPEAKFDEEEEEEEINIKHFEPLKYQNEFEFEDEPEKEENVEDSIQKRLEKLTQQFDDDDFK